MCSLSLSLDHSTASLQSQVHTLSPVFLSCWDAMEVNFQARDELHGQALMWMAFHHLSSKRYVNFAYGFLRDFHEMLFLSWIVSVSREHRILLRPEFVKQRQHRDRLHAACDTRNLLYTGHCSCRCLKAYKLILHVGIHESSHTYYCSDSKHSTSWLGTKWYQKLQTQHQINCCLKTFTTRWDFFVKIYW